MEFLVTTNNEVKFNNKTLQTASNRVFKLGNAIKKNWFEIAHIVASVDASKCYKEDGFKTVHDWVSKTFGIKKTASYSLLTIGKEYTREILSESGKVVGYGTNLVTDESRNFNGDFSKTQVEKMLPAGHDLAVEMVSNGDITPDMSARDISKIVKERTKDEEDEVETTSDEEDEVETTSDEEEAKEEDIRTLYEYDYNGDMVRVYEIPYSVIEKYGRPVGK